MLLHVEHTASRQVATMACDSLCVGGPGMLANRRLLGAGATMATYNYPSPRRVLRIFPLSFILLVRSFLAAFSSEICPLFMDVYLWLASSYALSHLCAPMSNLEKK
jgi:hypothetical protein